MGEQRSRAQTTVGQLVKVSFLVRLLALAVALGGLIGTPLTPGVYLAVLLLAAASYVGLAVPRAREMLVRHPVVAMTDVAIVVWVVLIFGARSPLVLASISTALLIGVLYPLPFAVLPAGVLVLSHLGEVWAELRAGTDVAFVEGIGVSAVLGLLVLVGHSVRTIQNAEARALDALSLVRASEAAERERTRIAREVHDGMAKSLQGLALTAAGLVRWIDVDLGRAKAEARSIADGAARAVEESRSLLSGMRGDDPMPELAVAVEGACRAWMARTGRHLEVDVLSAPALPPGLRRELLAILDEALENVRRHAPQARAVVRLEVVDGVLRLEVADDGPGFSRDVLADREAAGHFGIRGLHERAEALGATLNLRSGPGSGTRVVVTLRREAIADTPGAAPEHALWARL